MKKLILLLALCQTAFAEFSQSNESKPYGRDNKTFVIDFGTLNLINETSDSKPQSEVLQDWQNFLSTAPISTETELVGGQLDNFIGLGHRFDSYATVIDGKFKLPLLRALVQTYREDLETLYTLAPHALNGRTSNDPYKDELFSYKTIVYNCWLIGSLNTILPKECQYLIQAIALNEADAERLRMAFIRLIRVGSLQFNHQYCESATDPALVAEHDKIVEAKQMPKKYAGGFFGPSRELRSIPMLVNKLEGPYFKHCDGYQNRYPLEHRFFNL